MILITTLIIALILTTMRFSKNVPYNLFSFGFVLFLYHKVYTYYGDVVLLDIPSWEGMLNPLGSALLLVFGWRILIDLLIDIYGKAFDKIHMGDAV